ncbi:MAG TPA: MarR family winged helix-turn-helix transcriptional regulator [Devosia sp.]|nr:MarR family winged helix-turn-helix transcriptional regulator [Devosia sp.]
MPDEKGVDLAKDQPSITEYLKTVDANPEVLSHGKVLYIIHELSRLISTTFDGYMARHKLTHGQWWALMHLYENQGTSQSDLAEKMQMGRASAGKLLERMEAKGWIERRPDPRDNRIRRVYFADGATQVFTLMGKEGSALFHAMLGNLDPDDEMTLLRALRRIRENAEAELARNK